MKKTSHKVFPSVELMIQIYALLPGYYYQNVASYLSRNVTYQVYNRPLDSRFFVKCLRSTVRRLKINDLEWRGNYFCRLSKNDSIVFVWTFYTEWSSAIYGKSGITGYLPSDEVSPSTQRCFNLCSSTQYVKSGRLHVLPTWEQYITPPSSRSHCIGF